MSVKKEKDYILDYISNENSTRNLKLENKSTKHEHKGKLRLNVFKKKVAKVEQIECPSCGIIFPSKDSYKSHKRQHLTVDCQHCGKSLSYNTDFRVHQRRCTKDLSLDHPCTICKKTMKTRYELDRHYEKRHTAKILTKLYTNAHYVILRYQTRESFKNMQQLTKQKTITLSYNHMSSKSAPNVTNNF